MSKKKPVSNNFKQLATNPNRRSMAGPALLSSYTAPGAYRKSFAVTNTYFRSQDNTGLDALTKGTSPAENVQIEGKIKILLAIETTKDILCVKYTEDNETIAAGFTDGVVRLFSTADGECIQTLYDSEIEQSSLPVTSIKHRPVTKNYPLTNSIICSYTNGCVKCWNYNFCQCIYTIREKRQTLGLSYHPRLPKFITYGDDCNLYLYDEETRTQERILTSSDKPNATDGHTSRIFSACFNPRSNHELISGGWDDIVHFWDLRQPHAIRHLSGIHICGDGLDVNNRGTEILTCAWQKENQIQLYDYGSGKLITTLEPDVYSSMLYCGKFVGKDYISCGGTEPNIIRFIDMHSHMSSGIITGLAGSVNSVDTGTPKKPKKVDPAQKGKPEFGMIPKMIFCCGKKFYQIDFFS